MELIELIKANRSRVKRWHPDGIHEWTELEWAAAMAGEAGEACNAAKKLKRIQGNLLNIQNSEEPERAIQTLHQAKAKICKEASDTIIYALLLIDRCDGNAEEVIAEVFNQKSIEYGFPERV